MPAKLIVIAGAPASGKTTFAKRLSAELSVPYFSKDVIKIALAEYISIANRQDSIVLSKATENAILSIADSMLAVGQVLIIEANFRPFLAEPIKALLSKHNCNSLMLLFGGDLAILGKRFVERDKTDERNKANKMFELVEDYDKYYELFREYGEFDIGGDVIKVDTTEFAAVDFDKLIDGVKKWL